MNEQSGVKNGDLAKFGKKKPQTIIKFFSPIKCGRKKTKRGRKIKKENAKSSSLLHYWNTVVSLKEPKPHFNSKPQHKVMVIRTHEQLIRETHSLESQELSN